MEVLITIFIVWILTNLANIVIDTVSIKRHKAFIKTMECQYNVMIEQNRIFRNTLFEIRNTKQAEPKKED